MAGGRSRLITLGILFIAVLLAYRQRDAAKRAVVEQNASNTAHYEHSNDAFSNNPYYPPTAAQSHAPVVPPPPRSPDSAAGTTRGGPSHVQNTPRRELPNEVFKLLSRIPSPFPFLWRSLQWTVHATLSILLFLSPIITYPLLTLYHLTLTLISPALTLALELHHYVVVIPLGVVMSVARTLYPLYVFAAAAVLFGGVLGAAGGWVHGGLVGPWSSGKGRVVKGEGA